MVVKVGAEHFAPHSNAVGAELFMVVGVELFVVAPPPRTGAGRPASAAAGRFGPTFGRRVC